MPSPSSPSEVDRASILPAEKVLDRGRWNRLTLRLLDAEYNALIEFSNRVHQRPNSVLRDMVTLLCPLLEETQQSLEALALDARPTSYDLLLALAAVLRERAAFIDETARARLASAAPVAAAGHQNGSTPVAAAAPPVRAKRRRAPS